MRKTIGIIIAAIAVSALLLIFSIDSSVIIERSEQAYHITLADPALYENGVFSDSIFLQKGDYEFRFIPNGDSPELLSISLTGNSKIFDEEFELKGTSHDTGISIYYTWNYLGMKKVYVQESQQLEIQINPHGATSGPISVSLTYLE